MLVNTTVDDQGPDSQLTYTPDWGWNLGNFCPGCRATPGVKQDLSQVNNGTWHDTTFHPNNVSRVVSLTFTGNAVYVFNMLVAPVPYVTTLTNLTFVLDGQNVGNFYRTPEEITGTMYNVPVYVGTGLSNSQHSLQMVAGGQNDSLMLFDYIIYTAEEPDPPTSSSSPSILSVPPPSSSLSSLTSLQPSSSSSPVTNSQSSVDTKSSGIITSSATSAGPSPDPTTTAPTSDRSTVPGYTPTSTPLPPNTHHHVTLATAVVIGAVVTLGLVIAFFMWRRLCKPPKRQRRPRRLWRRVIRINRVRDSTFVLDRDSQRDSMLRALSQFFSRRGPNSDTGSMSQTAATIGEVVQAEIQPAATHARLIRSVVQFEGTINPTTVREDILDVWIAEEPPLDEPPPPYCEVWRA